VSGILFAAAFFVVFTVSERQNLRKHALAARQMKDQFQLEHQDTVNRESAAIRPSGVMVTMRDAANPFALKWTLAHTSTEEQDVVVLNVRMMGVGGPEYLTAVDQSFSEHEQMIFTKAISIAESFGKKVSLLLVPAGDIFAALVQAANSLEIDTIVSGLSSRMTAEDQAFHIGQAWEALPQPKRQFNYYVITPSGDAKAFYIGPHAPKLSPDDVQLVHRLWVNMRRDPSVLGLHHSDIITYALTRLAGQYAREKQEILRDLRNYRSAEAPAAMHLGSQPPPGAPAAPPEPSQLPPPPKSLV
jgi:hypothetical protein